MLTDTAIKNAKPQGKPARLPDERGLYLLIQPTGGKWWRLDYRFDGKHKTLSLGVWPDVSLKAAREKREEARRLLADGIDPGEHRKQTKAAKHERAANSFETVAREWLLKNKSTWSPSHYTKVSPRLEGDIFPYLGAKPIVDVTAPELLAAAKRIAARGSLETAHRVLQWCGQIFRFAIATGRAERNPVPDLRGALPPFKGKHFAAITEPAKLAELLRAIDGFVGTLPVACAMRLAPLVFVRPGELRAARWADIDLDKAEWRYRVTKTDVDHIVPLAKQAVAILREIQPLTGHGEYVFPSARTDSRPMSDAAILAAFRRMGFSKEEITAHGFRAIARTLLDEVLHYRADLIEHQLAHAVRDPLGRAYNRTAHLPERRAMMQAWADYLDKLKAGAEIIPINTAA
jgi:integrase